MNVQPLLREVLKEVVMWWWLLIPVGFAVVVVYLALTTIMGDTWKERELSKRMDKLKRDKGELPYDYFRKEK